MDGFQAMGVLILLALSIVVISTRNLPTRRRQPAPKRVLRRRAAPTTDPTRLATKPNAAPAKPNICAACHASQRRIRQIQCEQQMLVALWLFMLRHPTPPATDV